MRRMLDPKTIGGGNTTPARHCYMVVVDLNFHYIVYTTKDYGFEIGKEPKYIPDFETNSQYEELRAVGYYEAGGISKNSLNENEEVVVNYFYVNSSKQCNVSGYDITTHKRVVYSLIPSKTNWRVTKIF